MIRKILLRFVFIPFLLSTSYGIAQVKDSSSSFTFSGYIDAYVAHYTDTVSEGSFQKFPTTAPRSGFGLNIIMFTAAYNSDNMRAVASVHYGDIAKSTWSGTYNAIQEAYVGVRLHKKIWLDAGFFRTHVGTEGALPKENIASSVAVATFHEPYYESGMRLQYNPNTKLAVNLYVLNGYNIYEDNNKKKSFGMLVTYALGNSGNIGYSNYMGDDASKTADSVSHLRVYQNLFLNYQIKKLKIQIGGDYGIQNNSDAATHSKTATMYSGMATFKYQLKPKYAVYGRGEIFQDEQGFLGGIILDKNNKLTGYKLWGATIGAEYKPTETSYVRLEGRQLQMDANQNIYFWNGSSSTSRLEVLFHLGVSF